MLKKISFVLDKRQKTNLCILMAVIIAGAFVELLGVSSILPIVNVALEPEKIENTWYLAMINDFMGFTRPSQMLIFLSALVIGVYILKNVYVSVMYSLQYRFVFNNQKRLAVKMMKCYMQQDYLFHVSKNVAELQRNVTNDVTGFFSVVMNALQFAAEVSVCIVLAVFLLRQDVVTTLVVAGVLVVFGAFFTLYYRKALVKKGEQSREMSVCVSKWILQSFAGIKDIKVSNNESFFIGNYEKNYGVFAIIQRQQSMMKFVSRPIMESVCICGLLAAVMVRMAIDGDNLSSFIPTLSVFAVAAFRMLPSFNRITATMASMMFEKPSIDAVYEDLKEVEELLRQRKKTQNSEITVMLNDAICLEHISFKYPESEAWILDNASLKIRKNSSIGLIGASGAGKTTVVDLLLGLLEPQEGSIRVDGTDIRTNPESWHKNTGYIPQSIYLMDDTIRANIAFGIPEDEIREEEIERAMKEAQLDQFVHSLPEGIYTVIGDRGVRLSGGQRQRIGIARALYRNPDVLVLDEATAALDNETEKEVMEAIDGLHGRRTMIVIAHRLTTVKNCDDIYEVADGAIHYRTHEEIFGQASGQNESGAVEN